MVEISTPWTSSTPSAARAPSSLRLSADIAVIREGDRLDLVVDAPRDVVTVA